MGWNLRRAARAFKRELSDGPPPPDPRAWYFPDLARQAAEKGLDVNDYEDGLEGWIPAEPLVEEHLGPHLLPEARACEIGPGTGRWARHVAPRVQALHLVDHSPWLVQFLRSYFARDEKVRVHQGNGTRLDGIPDGGLSLVYAVGTFVALKLGVIQSYAREMARVLAPGGACVMDYIDIRRPEAWDWLQANSSSPEYAEIYAYHDGAVVHRVFEAAGLAVERDTPAGYNSFLQVRKP